MADSASQPVSFDDLIALNDEIAGLVRAGVPLETGLEGFAGAASERLADISARLARRLGKGQSLADALEGEGAHLPNVYRAVVEAGQRSGRLPQALESLSAYSRSLQDVRQRISLALIYPCIVLVTAYYLFWYFLGRLLPSMDAAPLAPGEQSTAGWVSTVRAVYDAVTSLGHVPPVLLVLLVVWWMVVSGSASSTRGIAGIALRGIPGLGAALRRFHLANFSELAAMLLEQDVPLSTAFKLAAETTGDTRVIADADHLAAVARRGEPLSEAAMSGTSLPPFLCWMLRSGERQGALAPALRQVSAVYRRRALHQVEWLKMLLPTTLTLVVGGSVVLLYALALWLPLTESIQKMSTP
ncbi:MAG: type II secretion system F family protein [Planctomycetaceae bacterium]